MAIILLCALKLKNAYYFQIITDKLDVSIIKMTFLMFYITVVLTHLYIYCYSAERLLTEVRQLLYANAQFNLLNKNIISEHQYGVRRI